MNQTAPPIAPPPVRRRPQFPVWLSAAIVAAALCLGALFFMVHPGDGTPYQYYGQWIGKDAPDFMLTNQDGKPEQLSALHGSVVLLTFGFTHCPNVCPTTLANLAAIRNGLPPHDQERVRVLFISVDPARDNPKALKDYVSFYSPAFNGLTGSDDDIAKVAKSYGAYYEAQIQDSQVASNYYTIVHSAYVYLIDPEGRYAVLYNNDKLTDHARMEQDIEHILQTVK